MENIFSFLNSSLGYIWNFILYLLSIPTLFINWVNSLPHFISIGIELILILITIIIAIKLFILIKEMIF